MSPASLELVFPSYRYLVSFHVHNYLFSQRFLNKTSTKGNVTIKTRFVSVPGVLSHLNFALLRDQHFNGNS